MIWQKKKNRPHHKGWRQPVRPDALMVFVTDLTDKKNRSALACQVHGETMTSTLPRNNRILELNSLDMYLEQVPFLNTTIDEI